jgi:hypothetical protein
MPSKSRIFRSRYGLLALTIPISLAMAAPASAAGLSAGQPAKPGAVYVNVAQARSQTDGYTDYDVEYQLEQTAAAYVHGTNDVEATASHCHDCGAVGIGFQVLVVSKQDLSHLYVTNMPVAISDDCNSCDVVAGGYQVVVAVNSPTQLSFDQIFGLAVIQAKLATISQDRLTAHRSQQLASELAFQAAGILGAGFHDGPNAPAFTPALHNSASPAGLAENSGPVVSVYRNYKY